MTQVLYRRPGGTEWETLGLEEAMDMVAERVKKTRDETFEETFQGHQRRRRAGREDPDGRLRPSSPSVAPPWTTSGTMSSRN
jgi:hypothetical protein